MMVLFGSIILLWVSREPGVPGWSQMMPTYTDSQGKVNKCGCLPSNSGFCDAGDIYPPFFLTATSTTQPLPS